MRDASALCRCVKRSSGRADTLASFPLSSPRGSEATGFSGSPNEPEFERSPKSAAVLTPACSRNGRSRPESVLHGTHAARYPIGLVRIAQTGAGRAAQFFASTSWSIVLSSVSSATSRFSRAFSSCNCFRRTWSVSGSLCCSFHRYSVCSVILSDQLRHGPSHLGLLQDHHDLLHRKRFLFTANPPSSKYRFCRKTNPQRVSKLGSRSLVRENFTRSAIVAVSSICKLRLCQTSMGLLNHIKSVPLKPH